MKTIATHTALLLAYLLFITGCSGIYPYKNNLSKNLLVNTKTDSGSIFSSVKARVDIYAVDNACKVTYKGTVDLKKPTVPVGLPQNSPIYLDFIFSHSGWLANKKGATGFDTFFKTRSGYEYIAEAHYTDGIYDVIMKEKKKGSKKARELAYGECKPK